MQIHIQNGSQRLGPFTLEQLNQTLQEGSISRDSALAWYEGCSGWIPLKQVPGLIPHTVGSGSIPPPPLSPPPPPVPPRDQGDATGGIIPYKNPHALIAYYLGIFGLLPLIGILLAIPAIILGISGLKKKKLTPIIKGSVHAWIGISLGIISLLYNIPAVIFIIIGICLSSSHPH